MSGLAELREVIDAISIESPTRYRLHGEVREVAAPGPSLVQQLQDEMYSMLYCGWSQTGLAGDELADRELVQALSAANRGLGTWEPGWVVTGPAEDGRIPVCKDGLTLWARPEQLRTRGRSAGFWPGARCRVRVGKELRDRMPGFYFAIGDGDERDDRDADERMVRLYWHVDAAGAPHLIRAWTEFLNPLRVPFRGKVLSTRAGYPRRDAGVLYLDHRYCARVASALPAIVATLGEHLRPEVPLFTKRLAPGLGLAEDPENNESFGQHRCRVVSEALWRAFVDGAAGPARFDHVCGALAASGLRPDALYLQPGSVDDYGALEKVLENAPENAQPAAVEAGSNRRTPRGPRSDRALRARRKQERQWRRANRSR